VGEEVPGSVRDGSFPEQEGEDEGEEGVDACGVSVCVGIPTVPVTEVRTLLDMDTVKSLENSGVGVNCQESVLEAKGVVETEPPEERVEMGEAVLVPASWGGEGDVVVLIVPPPLLLLTTPCVGVEREVEEGGRGVLVALKHGTQEREGVGGGVADEKPIVVKVPRRLSWGDGELVVWKENEEDGVFSPVGEDRAKVGLRDERMEGVCVRVT